jgi:acyl-CoA reductase-like NAD-dependent aldehyde dehydrogenase
MIKFDMELRKSMSVKVVSPFDQSLVCELEHESLYEAKEKLQLAQVAFESWSRLPLTSRITEVQKGLDNFMANQDEIAQTVSLQMGKPIREAYNEINTFKERADYCIAHAEEFLQPELLEEKEGFIRRIEHAPMGVILEIAAWNYPLVIPANVIFPALLAGNTVLLKHSEQTPLCAFLLTEAFSGLLIENLVSDLVMTHETCAQLIADKRVAHVVFTGSVNGGASVYQDVAREHFRDITLELGGKDAAYVAADADLAFAASNIVSGALYNAGQSCCAVERAYVHASVADEFIELVKQEFVNYKLGDPSDEATVVGPLALRKSLEFLQGQVNDAVARGAQCLLGGRVVVGTANFFEPTLLVNVPNDASVMQEESFGPVLPIAIVEDDEQALQLIQDTRFGLTASVWTKDVQLAEHFAREVRAGTIFMNRCDYLDPALPWSGYGESGKGSSLSRYGFLALTKRKSIHFRL